MGRKVESPKAVEEHCTKTREKKREELRSIGSLQMLDKEKDFEFSVSQTMESFFKEQFPSIVRHLIRDFRPEIAYKLMQVFSGQTVYVTEKNKDLMKKLKLNFSDGTIRFFLNYYKGQQFYIPKIESAYRSRRNCLICYTIDRTKKKQKKRAVLEEKRKQAQKYGISIHEVSRIYRKFRDVHLQKKTT